MITVPADSPTTVPPRTNLKPRRAWVAGTGPAMTGREKDSGARNA